MQSNSKKSRVNETRKIRSRTPLPGNKYEPPAVAEMGVESVSSVEMLKQLC